METITHYVNAVADTVNLELILFALTCGFVLTFVMACIAMRRARFNTPVTKPMVTTSESQQIFDTMQAQIRDLEQKINKNKQTISSIEEQLPRTTIVRFNPFRDSGVGGNQSFSLATVDSTGNGSIVTHLFSREMSRVSAKHIVNWESEVELSPEEKQALEQLR